MKCILNHFSLKCSFIFSWYRLRDGPSHNLKKLDINNQRISEHNGTLLIRKATIQDGGKYVCIVNNTNGQERAETELLIRGKNCVIHSFFRIYLRFLTNMLLIYLFMMKYCGVK